MRNCKVMAQIISASRRTDVPAFHSAWFRGILDAGFVNLPNPYNKTQISKISLRPEDLDAIVFWTKNPAPIFVQLCAIERVCERFYFQFTLNDYPPELEPGLPSLDERCASFEKLSLRLGPERVIWRYDPIIISNNTDHAYHLAKFGALCERLAPHTRRVMISLVDYYRKTVRNLRPLREAGYEFKIDADSSLETRDLLAELARTAAKNQIEIQSCAEDQGFSDIGIPPGACIDGELIEHLFGLGKTWKKDPGQRKHCLCSQSRDIGSFGTCDHACPYCYAAGSR
jgi:DNA repair photolyase